jgi:hypothetical protein
VPIAADADPGSGAESRDAPVDAPETDIERREAEQLGLF